MQNTRTVSPIAYVQSDFSEKFGIPRQSGRAPSLQARIVFTPPYNVPEALREIEGFSHLWILFDFSAVKEEAFTPTVRPPRLGGNRRVGVFASRSPFRPNRIGLSCVKLLRVETKPQLALIVSGADLLNGTPVLDIKPYLPFTDCIPEATSGYAAQQSGHALRVCFPEPLAALVPKDKLEGLKECLADDPRPSYQQDEERIYGMTFDKLQIKFRVKDDELMVIDVLKE